MMVFVHERRATCNHFVDQNTKCPPVNCKTVSCHLKYFWSEVFSCATETLSALIRLKELGKTKISKFNVAFHVHQDIFRFKVPVNNLISMQVAQPYQYLGSYELYCIFFEPSCLAQMIKQVSSFNILQEEIETKIVLEDVTHIDDKWVFSLSKNVFFSSRVQNLPLLNKNVLIYSFHCIYFVIDCIYHQKNFSK